MARKQRGNTSEAQMAFGQLLRSHLVRGTRPNGVPGLEGIAWKLKDFAEKVRRPGTEGADPVKTVGNWLSGRHTPGDLRPIEAALFGPEPTDGSPDKYRDYRDELRSAYNRANHYDLAEAGAKPVYARAAESASPQPLPLPPDRQEPFEKLCVLELDIPSQVSSWDDFVVAGQIRFGSKPEKIDGQYLKLEIRRAVLLPKCRHCKIVPGSFYRPQPLGEIRSEGARQSVFQACDNATLNGGYLNNGDLARFVAKGEENLPEVDILIHVEYPIDLAVTLVNAPDKASDAQTKFAQKWFADQVLDELRELDGSIRIASCSFRWTRHP